MRSDATTRALSARSCSCVRLQRRTSRPPSKSARLSAMHTARLISAKYVSGRSSVPLRPFVVVSLHMSRQAHRKLYCICRTQQHWNQYDCLRERVWVHKEQSGSTPTGLLKLVRILVDGFRRIRECSYSLEDVRMRQVFGRASAINKILIVNGEM